MNASTNRKLRADRTCCSSRSVNPMINRKTCKAMWKSTRLRPSWIKWLEKKCWNWNKITRRSTQSKLATSKLFSTNSSHPAMSRWPSRGLRAPIVRMRRQRVARSQFLTCRKKSSIRNKPVGPKVIAHGSTHTIIDHSKQRTMYRLIASQRAKTCCQLVRK